MSLPALIEIVPPPNPVQSQVFIPGSKSITNRALVLAALADTPPVLQGALSSEDTDLMLACLHKLGVGFRAAPDPGERANNTLTATGKGIIRDGGPPEAPLDLWVGNAGTAARFLAALVCLGQGSYRLTGTPRMHERPQAALFSALRQLGYRVDSSNDRLPAVIHGNGPHPGARCSVRIEDSSQFASALLLAGTRGGWQVSIEGEDLEESSYVRMTAALIASFPRGGTFNIEPDASSASYFWGAAWLLPESRIWVANWMERSLQIDARFPEVLKVFPDTISRRTDLGDSIMTAIVLAPFADGPKRFVDLGRLRLQESERVSALRVELAKCGASVVEKGDTLTVTPGPLHGAEVDTYDDHRIAMCFAMLGLVVSGMRIRNPECVRKTFPGFFQKIGQLATICDAAGSTLSEDQLLA